MNWHRGFNRTFVALAIGWLGYVLLIAPYMARRKDLHEFDSNLAGCNKEAIQSLKAGEPSQLAETLHNVCDTQARKAIDLELKDDSLHTWLVWPSVLALLGILVLPPLAAYGFFRLSWFVLAWIRRGFRQPAR
ncbi:MAG: hypothetical protein WAN14_01680 [Candidatus Acidiferrales bacterium]